MKLEVSTGQTKAPAGTLLVPVVLGQGKGDRVFLLIHSEGRGEGSDNLREECLSVLTHSVLEAQGGGYERLESALKELNGLLKGFLLSATVRDVHAIVGLLEANGLLHLSHVGRAEAYIIRDGVATQITEYSRGKPPSVFMHIASGPVQERDHFLVSTQRLLRAITPAQLAQIALHAGESVIQNIVSKLSAEKEVACVIHIRVVGGPEPFLEQRGLKGSLPMHPISRSRARAARSGMLSAVTDVVQRVNWSVLFSRLRLRREKAKEARSTVRETVSRFLQDLHDPARKRRAHLLLLAGSATLFLIIWMLVQLSLSSQRNQTRGELANLVKQINTDITTADNRQLAGDTDSANAILQRAEDRARQVMTNESGLFRSEALELLDRIKSKREEMNRVIRVVPPRVMANLSAKKADILAQGFLGSPNGEFLVYDRQNLYRVSLNTVENLEKLGTEELILDAVSFPRFQSKIFLTTGNSIIEIINGQPTTMKTEDPAGWVTGADIKTYLRYLYLLAPERKQIYKYERLASKYGPPAEYNINGDLSGAIDMTITGPAYVLRDISSAGKTGQRDVVKLLRGEKQTFNIRNLPPGALDGVTRIFKSSQNGNFYFLDPENKRIVVTTSDGDLGDSLYLKQYVLDSDQVGRLKDLYVDPEDARLYVLDEKKLYAIDLQNR
ncbi:MAG: hypothetical protein WC840_01575 [Candidatus Peribacteraceae bacterium]